MAEIIKILLVAIFGTAMVLAFGYAIYSGLESGFKRGQEWAKEDEKEDVEEE